MTLLALTPAGDPLPEISEAPNTIVEVVRDWNGQHVTYTLLVDGQEFPVDQRMLRSVASTVEFLEQSQNEFVDDRKQEQHSPGQFGLDLLPPRPTGPFGTSTPDPQQWIRRDGNRSTDPVLVFSPAQPGWGTDPRRHDARWEVHVPTLSQALPLATAHWNDRDKIADLAQMVLDPEGCWTLLALTQPEAAARHAHEKAQAQARWEAQQRDEANKKVAKRAWRQVARSAVLPADVARKRLRDAHVGDGSRPGAMRLMLRSVPFVAETLHDPRLVAVHGIDPGLFRINSSYLFGYTSLTQASHPVVGWELRILGSARWSQDGDPSNPAFAALVEQVGQAAGGYGFVVQRDGAFFWVRHEGVFDACLEAGIAQRAYHRPGREVPVPKQNLLR